MPIRRNHRQWQGSSASASTNRPPIVTRAQWGADESLRDKHLEKNTTVKVAFVHHTAGSNNYSAARVLLSSAGSTATTCAPSDTPTWVTTSSSTSTAPIYEGRAGSITKPVRSAATGGFNTRLAGDCRYGQLRDRASDRCVWSPESPRSPAYRLSRFYRNPFGRKTLTADVGSSRYSAGRKVQLQGDLWTP